MACPQGRVLSTAVGEDSSRAHPSTSCASSNSPRWHWVFLFKEKKSLMVLENSEEDHQWAEYLWNYWNIGRKSTDCRIDKTGGKRPITHREGCGSGGGCSWRRQSQSRQAMLSHHSGGHLLAWENVPPNCWLKEAISTVRVSVCSYNTRALMCTEKTVKTHACRCQQWPSSG